MFVDDERRQVLLIGCEESRRPLREVFASEFSATWHAVEADCVSHARFVLQHTPCDVVLMHESFGQGDDGASLSWLAAQHCAPVLLVADIQPDQVAKALELGVIQWLPRAAALAHPALLAAALGQLVQLGDLRRRVRRAGEALSDCRRQVNGLIRLLWQAAPSDSRCRWFTQRHMMERLEEEVARAERHDTPLALVLGEIESDGLEGQSRHDEALSAWTSDRISKAKRRQDVAGQYGPDGYMLLLGHTPETGAISCCRRLQDVLQHPPLPGAAPRGPIRARFGIAEYSQFMNTPKAMLRRAEERLERARASHAVLAIL